MKLLANKAEYKVEDIGQIWRTEITTAKGEKVPVQQCSMHDIALAREGRSKNAKGIPVLIALDLFHPGKHKLIFFPAPAQDMDVEIEYFPPRRTL